MQMGTYPVHAEYTGSKRLTEEHISSLGWLAGRKADNRR